MYEIIFYHSRDGKSEIEDYLDELAKKAETSKTDRINRTKILSYLYALSQYGTRIGQPAVKHIEGSIWELRPLKNRIFFFYWKDDKFVLLHHFIKKSQKTPAKELEQARLKPKATSHNDRLRLCTHLTCRFSAILHYSSLKYIQYSLRRRSTV